jgi:hypothetical protein
MHAVTGTGDGRAADQAPDPPRAVLHDDDALLSEPGALYPLFAFAGTLGDPPPADAREAPSGSATAGTVEERRSEMDERILAGLLWS